MFANLCQPRSFWRIYRGFERAGSSIIFKMNAKLGAHLSIAGGHHNALQKIKNIGGNCLQIFSTSPRSWQKSILSSTAIEQFNQLRTDLGISPIYFHASYLINLANPSSGGHLSKEALINELNLAPKLGIKGAIIHLGSFRDGPSDYHTLIENIRAVLRNTPRESAFIIENAGNRKIGRSLEEIGNIIKDLNDERVRVCLDTCHLFAAGYDFRTEKTLEDLIQTFDHLIGLEKLEVWQFNDSKDPFGSLRDRHENIGEGTIGKKAFGLIMNHPKMRDLPFIIETPGFDQMGPDKKNLDILKSLL